MVPENAAGDRVGVSTAAWSPVSFAEGVDPHKVADDPGMDFLTWLWCQLETKEGVLRLEGLPEMAMILEGPLTLFMEGDGAHETVLRKGAPTLSPESTSCLKAGKKLSKAKLNLSVDGELWSVSVDETFAFRGMKVTDPEERLDPLSLFQDRMTRMERFNEHFYGLFDHFCQLRADHQKWPGVVAEMKSWVAARD